MLLGLGQEECSIKMFFFDVERKSLHPTNIPTEGRHVKEAAMSSDSEWMVYSSGSSPFSSPGASTLASPGNNV